MGRLYSAYVEVGPRFTGFGEIKNQGEKAGREYGKSLVDAAEKAAKANVRRLGEAMAKARDAEADAAGKVRVAEQRLNEVRANTKSKASQVAAAEEALASAQRKSAKASDVAKDAASALEKARDRVSATADSAGKTSGNRFSRAFKGSMSRLGGEREGKMFASRFGVGLNGAIGGIVAKSAGVFAAGFAALKGAGFAKDAIASASDLNETVSKSATVFGNSQKIIDKFAASSAKSLGQSKNEAIGAAAQFGNMFTQLGIGQKPAAEMSTQMVKLASDFASFHNADITEVLDAQQAAFRGEYDSIQRFVPTINAAAVEQEGLRLKLAGTKDALTDQDKAIAVQSLLMRGAGKAMGDFARTSGGLANQQRILKAQFADSKAELGQKLLPVATRFFTFLNSTAIPAVKGLSDLLFKGDFTKGFGDAFNVEEDSGFVTFLLTVNRTAKTVFKEIRGGITAFGEAWKANDGDVTSSGFPGVMEKLGYAARQTFGFFKTEVLPRLVEFGGYIKNTVIPIIGELVQDRLSKMGEMFTSIKNAIQANRPELDKLGGALVSVGKFLVQDVLPPLQMLQNNVFPSVGRGASALIYTIGALVKAFDATKGAISTAFDAVKSAINTALSATSSAIGTAISAVKGAFSTAFNSVAGAVGTVITTVTGAFSTAVAFIRSVWSTIVSAVSGPVNAVIGVLQAVWSRIMPILVLPFYIAKDTISKIFQGIQATFTTVKTWVAGTFAKAWSAVSGVLSGPLNTALSGVRSAWNGITTAFSNAKTWATGTFSKAWAAVQSVISIPISAAKTALDTTWSGVRGAFNATKNWATSTFSRAWAGLKTIITTPISNARTVISGILGNGKGGLQYVFSTGVTSISRIWNRLQDLAKKPIRFIIDTVLNKGLISGFNWIANKFDAPTIAPIPLPKGFAAGGKIPGRPSDVDNTFGFHKGGAIPLATGEFIVNARQTAKHLPLLEAINSGTRGYADGGLLGKLKGAITGAYSKGKSFAGDVADFTQDAAGWLKKKFAGPLGRLNELGDSAIAKIVTAAPRKIADVIIGKSKDLLKGLFGGGPNIPVGSVVNFRGERLNQRTIAMLLNAEAMLRKTFHIMQGSYSTRVAASGSTHAGGGAMDTDNAGAGWDSAVRALRAAGFAAWHRTPAQGPWGHHIHSIAIGDPSASPAAKNQVKDFLRGGDGLGGMAAGGRVGVYDKGGRWPSGTIGINTSGKTETVIPGDGMIKLHPDSVNAIADAIAARPTRIDGRLVDAAVSRRALSY